MLDDAAAGSAQAPLVSIDGLRVSFQTREGRVEGVKEIGFDIRPGECVAVVGESGSGKSVTSLAIMGLQLGYLLGGSILVETVTGAGAIGVNMEDGTKSPDLLCAKIAAAKGAKADLFLNARIDVFLRGLATGEAAVAEVIARAGRYAEAGCDGVFVPGLSDPDGIRTIAAEISRPLNVMAVPGLPSPAELASLGVRRLSAGGALASAALGQTRRLAERFLQAGGTEEVLAPGLPYLEVQALFAR